MKATMMVALALGAAVIGNDNVILGVNDAGHLNIDWVGSVLGLPATDPLGWNDIGLRNGDGTFSATEAGCECEGWGVAVDNSNVCYGSIALGGSLYNSASFSASHGDDSGVSTVTCGSSKTYTVVHDFYVSEETPYVFEIDVSIENTGSDISSLVYRRVIDWDITPDEFNEFVTIQGSTTTPSINFVHDNGFCSVNPLTSCSARSASGDFIDNGPSDHGFAIEFDFGALAAGETFRFKLFFGATEGEIAAIEALAKVGVELYTLGQPASDAEGLPYTAFMGFANVGGEKILQDECQTVAEMCAFEFSGYEGSIPTYDLSASVDNLAFSDAIVSKSSDLIGQMNSYATFVISEEDGQLTAAEHNSAWTPNQFKVFGVWDPSTMMTSSMIGHETFQQDSKPAASGQCIRVSFHAWQVLNEQGWVVDNVHSANTDLDCAVFRVA